MKVNIVVIPVLYKNPKEQVEKLEISLVENGVEKKDIFFVNNEKNNVGYGGAINEVVKKQLKYYDYFLILNPDVVLDKNCLSKLVETFDKDKKIGIVGPKILDERGNIWSLGGVLDKKRYSGGLTNLGEKDKEYSGFYDVDYVPGTAMLIKKEVFEKVGCFAEDYFLYYEDDDFSLRAKRAGFRLVINPQSVIVHNASYSTGKNSPLMQYYMARNHMLFVERFGPLSVKLYELMRLPKTWGQATKYERLGIIDYFIRRFGKRDYWS